MSGCLSLMRCVRVFLASGVWRTGLCLWGLGLGLPGFAQNPDPAPVLRVCAWPDAKKISYRLDGSSGWNGVDADLAKEWAKDLGAKLEFVESSMGSVVQDLARKRCQVAMFGIPITQELSTQLRFSKPTLFSELHGVAHRWGRVVRQWSDVDRPGGVISVVQSSPQAEQIRQMIRHARVDWTSSPVISEYDVESGRADVWLTDVLTATEVHQTKDWTLLMQAPAGRVRTLYGFAVARDDELWAGKMDAFVRDIKRDGRLQRAAETYGLGKWVVTR